MADPGFLSGFIGAGISTAIAEILTRIRIAVHCREELESLRRLLIGLQGINSAVQKCRVDLNSGQLNSHNLIPRAVNQWFLDLDMLLHRANETVQHCTIPKWDCISRYKTSKRLAKITREIREHRDNAAVIGITTQFLQWRHQSHNESSSASVSSAPPLVERAIHIEERLVVGQDDAYLRLEQLVLNNTPRIGVVAIGGSGKTLLLKRFFNSVRNLSSYHLLLWLTVSTAPSFPSLRTELSKQISFSLGERPESSSEETVKIWLQRTLRENKFALFLDDVWEASASDLLEELCVPLPLPPDEAQHSNVIIVSSRSRRALLQMGIPPTPSPAIVDMKSLTEDDSWKLFSFHAFPYNNGDLPPSIHKEIARNVCKQCGGLPLAIKVIGRAMSAVVHLQEWESALQRLRNTEPVSSAGDAQQELHGRLRLSYDSLADFDVSLQLCFLYLAAYPQDAVILTSSVSMYWIGEGLVTGDNAYVTAQSYVNLLADRCLIEVVHRDIDGLVTYFRVHDVLHDLARHIGMTEENCFFHAGGGLEEFPEFEAHFRISLWGNELRSVPNPLRGPHLRALILSRNFDLKVIPSKVIASMTSLQILDLSHTSLQSLPKNIGQLKHLICLRLAGVPIKRLPNSVTSLYMLQIVDLSCSSITELPPSIHKLSSLRILNIKECKELQCLPHGISKLTSLEELRCDAICSPGASINDLSALKHLKRLRLVSNGETIQHGTLGNMMDMEILHLELSMMETLPQDINALSKLRNLWLECPDLTRLELSFSGFQQLSTLTLKGCKVKELPQLHELVSLKQLNIFDCPEIEELPKEFGERGAFPKLEVLNLGGLHKLGELAAVDEGAMPSLKTLTIVQCESLKMVAENYWNLKSVKKIGIYGCSIVVEKLREEGNVMERKRAVQTFTKSSADTRAFISKYNEMVQRGVYSNWGEFWSTKFFQAIYPKRLTFGGEFWSIVTGGEI